MKILLLLVIQLLCASCIERLDSKNHFDGPTVAMVGPNSKLYVADGYYNSKISVFSLSGKYLFSFGSKGYGKGQFHNPHAISFSRDNRLFVADRDNGRIQIFNLHGDYLDEIYGSVLGRPWAVSISENGEIFVVDGGDQDENNQRSGIVKLTKEGKFLTRFSKFGSGKGELNWGHAITTSDNGRNIFVVDLKNHRIQKFVESDSKSHSYNVADNWPKLDGKKIFPLSIAFKNNILYVSQENEGAPILLFNSENGNIIREIGGGIFKRAHGISVDYQNTVWVADTNADKVYRLTNKGDVILTIGGRK